MKHFKILLFSLFFIFFSVNLIYSTGSCCYSLTDGEIISTGISACDGGIKVGNSEGNCDAFTNDQQGCLIDANTCTETVPYNGNNLKIWNTPSLGSRNIFYKDTYCPGGLVDITDSKCSILDGTPNPQTTVTGNGGTTSGGQVPQPPTTGGTQATFGVSDIAKGNNCAGKSGGSFGFFVNKNSCETLLDYSNNNCLYNPYLGGFLGSYSSFIKTSLSLWAYPIGDILEDSCVSKNLIRIVGCYGYKTEDNCNNNRADISDSCNWIPTNDFSFLSEKSGICVSKSISSSKFYNKYKFGDRGNLIKNPSFEKGNIGWTSLENNLIKTSQNTYSGNKYYSLDSTGISQKINNLTSSKSYIPSLYLKYNSSIKNSGINLTIEAYSNSNILITSIIYQKRKKLNDLTNKVDGIFEKVIFDKYILSFPTKYIKFKLESIDSNSIDIDAISFSFEENDEEIFKPVEIISSNASNCNLCFEKNNLNTCTQEKSDLLGDCSYMVSEVGDAYDTEGISTDSSKYLGYQQNLFMFNTSGDLDENLKWTSQSLANSLLFCELYVDESQCTNSSNYVNSMFKDFHPNSDPTTLCKWDNNHGGGCFKDSNNDGYTDTFKKISGIPNGDIPIIISRGDDKYYKSTATNSNHNPYSNELDKRSFNRSCDLLPPNSYIYFTGKNTSMGEVIVTDDYTGIIGLLTLHLNLEKTNLESCNNYYDNTTIYLDTKVNDKYITKFFETSQFVEAVSIANFFSDVTFSIDSQGVLNNTIDDFKEHFFNLNKENNFSFVVMDQAGNIGKEYNFSFEQVDLNPPKIILESHSYTPNSNTIAGGSFGNNTIFDFYVDDLTNYECNFNLKPFMNSIDSNFYNSSIFDFNQTNNMVKVNNIVDSNLYNFSFNVGEYIFNSTNNPQYYELEISCTDLFGQTSVKSSIFNVDFDTSIVVLEPDRYQGNSSSIGGYLNGPTEFVAISSEKSFSTNSCSLNNFPDLVSNSLTISSLNGTGGIFYSDYGVKFYKNITGTLNFTGDGVKNGKVKCTDRNGNIFEEDLSYYYDTKNPKFLNYSLVNINYPDNTNSVYFNGTNYFTIKNSNSEVKVNLSFNGTGTWVDSIQNLSALNETSIISQFANLNFGRKNILDVNYIDIYKDLSSIILSNFELGNVHNGINQTEDNLFLKRFSFNYTDKSKNSNSAEISYYYDNSKPTLIFGGDIISQDGSRIYTSSKNPNIKLTFNTPSYRKYDCSITGEKIISGRKTPLRYLIPSNLFKFELYDIYEGGSVDIENEKVDLKVICRDVYNKTLSNTFSIIYDDTPPILNNIGLDNGEVKIISVSNNYDYFRNIEDKVFFNLEDTNEVSYACYYNFTTLENSYFCKNDMKIVNFKDSGIQTINKLLTLIKTNNPTLSFDSNYICTRNKKNFELNLKNKIDFNNSFSTTINLSGYCTDKVGLRTETKSKIINITYNPNDFISFKFEYRDKKAYAKVKSFIPYEDIKISSNIDGSNEIETLVVTYTDSSSGVPIYEYSSINGFNLDRSEFDGDRDYNFYAVSSGKYIHTNLRVDTVGPKVLIKIPDENEGRVYSGNFSIGLEAVDGEEGKLSLVELFLNNQKIFSFNGINVTYENSTLNVFKNIGISFTGNKLVFSNLDSIEFINGVLNRTYNFRFDAYDEVNNKNSISKNITISDGFGIFLVDSINSKVGPNKYIWLTKNKAPIINFRTTKAVEKCYIIPLENEKIEISSNVNKIKNFSVNLSKVSGFNLNELNSRESLINISCIKDYTEGKYYNYQRKIKYIDSLPDYVLSSSKGFIFNEEPYRTSIEVKSVGPYRIINCKYNDGSGYKDFNEKDDILFNTQINFKNTQTGVYDVKIQCTDLVENVGPEKVYNFLINKSAELVISDLVLYNTVNNYYSKPVIDTETKTIYVSSLNNLKLEFKLNKKNNVKCNYDLNEEGFFGFISFIRTLFSIGTEEIISSENPNVYSTSLNLPSEDSNLNIKCRDATNMVEGEYKVKFLDDVNNVSSWN